MENQIRELFVNPEFGLISFEKFRKKLLEKKIDISREKLRKILEKLPEHELFRVKRKRQGNTITDSWKSGYQADLIDISNISSRNKNFKFILTCVDIFSRRAWAIALKNKTGVSVAEGFRIIFKDNIPLRVTTDNGKEFLNSTVQGLFKKLKIVHRINQPGDHNTMGLIERFNRTLRGLIGRNFERVGKLRWIDDLDSLIKNYNTTIHRTINSTPLEVWKSGKKNQKIHREIFGLIEGDKVRLLIKKNTFDKKTGQVWSKNIYTIVRREGFKYIVSNKEGDVLKTKYRESELLKTVGEDSVDSIEKLKKREKGIQKFKRTLRKEGVDLKKIRRKPSRRLKQLRA